MLPACDTFLATFLSTPTPSSTSFAPTISSPFNDKLLTSLDICPNVLLYQLMSPMAAPNPSQKPSPRYPEVNLSNTEAVSASPLSSSSGLYPSVDMECVAENLFPEDEAASQNLNPQSFEEVMIAIPGAIIHLIESENSVELASGVFSIVGLRQGDNVVAVLARIGEEIQWPLAKDEASVRLDDSHYFFSLRVPGNVSLENEDKDVCIVDKESEMLNYGLTIASKGQEDLLKHLDQILENYSCFSLQKVEKAEKWLVLDGSVPRELSPADLASEEKKELMEEISAAYWTTLAPNVDDYSGRVAKLIAAGSGQLVRGILWCGDVTVDQMKLGNELLKTRMGPCSNSEISPAISKRMSRVKQLTKMSENVAEGILSGVVKVSGFFTSSIVNSKVGKKFFSLMPGEIVLASMDGFNKICDAVEVAGRNVMSTTSVVTTGLVSQRFGLQAGNVTNEGFGAAGHAIGTAWAVFKIRKAINPTSVIKATNLAKAAAREHSKAKNQK